MMSGASSLRCSAARRRRGRSRRVRSSRAGAAHRRAPEHASDDPEFQARLAAFLQGLRQIGLDIGRNVRDRHPLGRGNADRIRRYAAELVALAPDVILAHGACRSCAVVSKRPAPCRSCSRSSTIRSAAGFVESLARPGGNVTGFMNIEYT